MAGPVGAAPRAWAQPAAGDAAMAETLFEDAKRLMAAGDYTAACPKLAESNRLDPGTGTLTALALCHEQIGKTATAWAEFIDVVTQAQQTGRADREKFARQHVAALEPKLARLTVTVADETARLADVAIRRDRVAVGAPAWGVAAPIDPGEHLLEAAAPGYKPWSEKITIGGAGEARTVAVPALEVVPAAVEAPPPVEAPPAPPPPNTRRTVAFAVAGGAVASLAVGAYFGVQALSKSADAKRLCSPSSCTNPSAVQINADAKTSARLADVFLGVGIAAAGVSAYFFLTSIGSPAQPAAALTFAPEVSTRGGGASLLGAW
ncbi:MAG TPA: hypothetical protein VKU41_21115 [Polyangiaceae bacterium]|nr:hypothetical protein [Polyangiaceae bacterium]